MRSTENQIAKAAMQYLATLPSGEASVRAVKENIPKYYELTAADFAPSPTRKGEAVWEQQVRNIVSHRNAPDNYIARGLMARRPRRLSNTTAGKKRVTRSGS